MPSERAGPDPAKDAALGEAVAAAKAGDELAFATVYRAVQPGLLRYLRVLVGAEAEDVAAEAWLQIARDIAKFKCGRPESTADDFRGWAATIARNRGLDHLRRVRARPVAAEVGVEVLDERPGADDTAADALTRLDTDRAVALIASLPQDQAEAVLLRVVLGLDAEAAAKVLGKRAGAVRTAAHRGLKTLATRLPAPLAQVPGPRGVTEIEAPALREVR